MNAIATQQLTEIPFVLNKPEQENDLAITDNGGEKRLKALIALNEMRSEAEERGFLSEKEIESEIQAARVNE